MTSNDPLNGQKMIEELRLLVAHPSIIPQVTPYFLGRVADEIERLNGIIRAARDRFATSDEGEEVGDAMDTILMEADA